MRDEIKDRPQVSIVVPAYLEAENIPLLVKRIKHIFLTENLNGELLIIDDNSNDGTDQVIRTLNENWVHLHIRESKKRDLSQAVVDGLLFSRGDILIVMDADLSHPPEKIGDLISALETHEFAVGSRYVPGASTYDSWTFFRYINSLLATWMAKLFTDVRDPMSGFFALKRKTFQRAPYLNPLGYKIGLELIVKCQCQDVTEVPIHFSKRHAGKSKLNILEQLKYIRHILRLISFKYMPLRALEKKSCQKIIIRPEEK